MGAASSCHAGASVEGDIRAIEHVGAEEQPLVQEDREVVIEEDDDGPGLVLSLVAAGFASLPFRNETEKTTEWINLVLQRAWPSVTKATASLMRTQVAPALRDALPAILKDHVSIQTIDIGSEPPKIVSIVVQDLDDGMNIRITIDMVAGLSADITVGSIHAGVRSFTLDGEICVDLRPLIGELPIIGTCQVYFLNPPTIQYQFTGVVGVANTYLVRQAVRAAVDHIIAGQLVMPNMQVVQIAETVEGPTLESLGNKRAPQGVLRVRPRSATALATSDWNIRPNASCDAYLRMKLGSQARTSSTVRRTTEPKWPEDELHDFVVYDAEQLLSIHVWDEDFLNPDDYLGCIVPLWPAAAVSASGTDLPMFQKANRIKGGAVVTQGSCKSSIQLHCEWFEPVADRAALSLGTLASAQLGKLTLPKGMAEAVQLRMRINGLCTETPVRKTPKGMVISAAAAADQDLKKVIKNGRELGLNDATLARLTGLSEEVVAEVTVQSRRRHFSAGGGSCCSKPQVSREGEITVSARRTLGSTSCTPRSTPPTPSTLSRVDISADMNLSLPPGCPLDCFADLELLNQDKDTIASVKVALSDFKLAWPRPNGKTMGVYTLKDKDGREVQIEACLSVAGLVSATAKAPTDRSQAATSARATRGGGAAEPAEGATTPASVPQQSRRSTSRSRPWSSSALVKWRK